jgi:hypothetical protein
MLKFSNSLRDWYFTDGGGMFLSRTAHCAYTELQETLTALLSRQLTGIVSDEHYDDIRKLCSALRSKLTQHIGSR